MKLRHAFHYVAVVCIPVLSSNIGRAQTPITGCAAITNSGSYVLKSNITAVAPELKPTWIPGYSDCIVIAADFVTIDLSGYLITGPGGFSVAIALDTTTRIGDVVQAGSITGFSDFVGFAGTAHTINGVNASNNGDAGIYLRDGGNRVISNSANNNGGYGIYVTTCPNLLLENTANGNGTNIREPVGCADNRQENVPKTVAEQSGDNGKVRFPRTTLIALASERAPFAGRSPGRSSSGCASCSGAGPHRISRPWKRGLVRRSKEAL